MTVQNILWGINRASGPGFYATTWHQLVEGIECDLDLNWDAEAKAEAMQASGEMRSDAFVIATDTPIVPDQTLAGPVFSFELSDGVMRLKT